MPLYDCMLLAKPHVKKEALLDLVARVSKHVFRRNGVITDMKSFGTVHLGYGIKKLDGRFYQGQLMQMTMMATPNMNKELHYLNKEDRLLRWLLVKHRDTKYGMEFLSEQDTRNEINKFHRGSIYDMVEDDDDDDDDDDDEYDVDREGNNMAEDNDDDDEYDVDQEGKQIDG
ncbi:putative ribosomal protein S6 [Rosa chinensis]|uniref:Putative ribosomal protein S6 n=1 Tax=Rosa chinensis TaxID=74649 RepID=A0A2P6RIG6_ROSCH|nr:WD repeat-containing protein 55 homolog [Rosa chinensis]PRQ46201.1 putative ribosomal protein S6 [Rosa chinensis]